MRCQIPRNGLCFFFFLFVITHKIIVTIFQFKPLKILCFDKIIKILPNFCLKTLKNYIFLCFLRYF